MSDVQEVELVVPPKRDVLVLAIASARDRLTRFLPRAVEIIEELAEYSENDRVRLAAAESIADRVGLTKGSTVDVRASQSEHDIAEQETLSLLARIGENQAEISAGAHTPPLDVLIVLEGDEDEVLATVST